MAASPPPPPPPPAPAPIGKPNNAKLLDSIHKGIGLKKVPDLEKNDRSVLTASVKSGGSSAPSVPPGIKSTQGSALSLADAIKARKEGMDKGNPAASAAQQKRLGAPSPNQATHIGNQIPKPPSQNSKPSITNSESNNFPPPPPPPMTDNSNKPMAPPPMPFAPPPMYTGNATRPPAPPRIIECNSNIPLLPPPMPQDSLNKTMAPPPMNTNMPIIPQSTFDPKLNNPTPTRIVVPSIPNNMAPIGYAKNTPPQCPPPPPPSNIMPTKQLSYCQSKPPTSNIDMESSKPPQAAKIETARSFDSKFTFVDDSYFPDPSTVLKRRKE